jgi:phosphatidylserine/phosphatidylglycerophosphate/cardiolipin synthase-like enzyme
MNSWRRTAVLVASTVLVTLACVFAAANFTGGEKKIERRVERLYALEDPRFAHELGALLGPPFIGGTRAKVLRNGDEIFPAMLAAIHGAASSITFETYIYWSGEIGAAFADALVDRACHGARAELLSAARAGRRRRGADVQQLADRWQREHAADVPARESRPRRDRSISRPRTSCPTSSRFARWPRR